MSKGVDSQRLRALLEQMLEGIEVDLVLFTSFELDPAFFEQNVLLGLDEGLNRAQTIEEIEALEQACDDYGVVVFHDVARLQKASQKTIDFATIPVAVRNGVFHPKVVLVSGHLPTNNEEQAERVVRVMVSSANLTYAGWGSNLEAGGIVEVRDRAQAEPLAELLEWLSERAGQVLGDGNVSERLEGLESYLQEKATHEPTAASPLLHVTIPGSVDPTRPPGLRPLLWTLAQERTGSLTVASPFFSGLDFFEELDTEFAGREVTIAPGSIEGNLVELDADTLKYLETSRFALARLEQPDDGGPDRRQHLKCFAHDDGVVVGSHNASFNALGSPREGGRRPQNVEVSLEFPGSRIDHLIKPVANGELTPKDGPIEPPQSIVTAGNVPIVALTVDWEARTIELRLIDGSTSVLGDYEIRFPAPSNPASLVDFNIEEGEGELPLARIDAKSLAESKKFEVHRLGEEPSLKYVGFINEKNRQARDRRREPTLMGCLQTWCALGSGDPEPSSDAESMLHRQTLADREAHLVGALRNRRQGRLENYFYIFRAASQMRRYLDSARDDDELAHRRAYSLLLDSSGSIEHIIEHIEQLDEQTEKEHGGEPDWLTRPVARGLLATELTSVLEQIESRTAGDFSEAVDDFRGRLSDLGSEFDQLIGSMRDERIDFLVEELARQEGTFEP